METPPLLLSTTLVVPDQFQGLPHVLDLINTFLMPKTIDAAVYNDLQRVIRAYGDVRPWTVGAMDGAAARGRLDLLQWLRANRTEGCSAEAFTGAAANGHLDALRWLYRAYPDLFDMARELATAARHGHAHVAAAFRGLVSSIHEVEPALDAAAANGFVNVLKQFLPGPYNMTFPLSAAVRNGHLAVVQLVFDKNFEGRGRCHFDRALQIALEEGYTQLLLPRLSDEAA